MTNELGPLIGRSREAVIYAWGRIPGAEAVLITNAARSGGAASAGSQGRPQGRCWYASGRGDYQGRRPARRGVRAYRWIFNDGAYGDAPLATVADVARMWLLVRTGESSPVTYSFIFSGASGTSAYRAIAWKDMNTMGFHCALGYYDYDILDCLQVDMYNDINSSFIGGDWEHPKRRFGGAGGANKIASMCWRTIVMAEQEERKSPKRVDFISSLGYLDGSPRVRENAGLPANTGPYRVITEKAIFSFDEKTRRMKLLALTPWARLMMYSRRWILSH